MLTRLSLLLLPVVLLLARLSSLFEGGVRAPACAANELLVIAKHVLGTRPTLVKRNLVKRSSHKTCRLVEDPSSLTGNIPSNGSVAPSSTSVSHTGSSSPSSTAAPSLYTLVSSYSGNDFFTGWDFNTGPDPTHGVVDYLTSDDARAAGLAFVDDQGHFVMKVDTAPIVTNLRKSVRITTRQSFNGGLLIMDAAHMPTGCGTWPAFWTNGPDWPNNGEIDIVEGVNDYVDNQATVHTRHGCAMPTSFNTPSTFAQVATGQLVGGTNCAAPETNNQGCGVRILDSTSFGSGFNNNGGGAFAMLWDDSGIAVYYFPRSRIPADISIGEPIPSQWGKPAAKWPANSCDPFEFFKDHVAIFDTTLCGDWAGNVWNNSGVPGQEQSCARRTGIADCSTFVLNHGESFTEAYWEVAYVKLYESK